jgi:hypothetical protein
MLVWCEGGWVAYSLSAYQRLASDGRYGLLGDNVAV